MTEPDQALIARLSSDFAAITAYLARASADLRQLELVVAQRAAQPQPPPVTWPAPTPPAQPAEPRSDGWIGKALAVAGVAVTLVGVALLLVLAAQAGILRPEIRVAAGAVLAAGLIGAGWWLHRRPGGRVGSIALAATGIAAAYIDLIAVTTIYEWVSAPVGLAIAAVVAVAGLMLARRWDAEHLGLLVLVPLIGLAPVLTDGVTLLLVGFMLALSASSLPIALGKDWIGMHAARVAAATLPLLVALASAAFSGPGHSAWLAVACSAAAVLAIGGALILLQCNSNALAVALLSAVGTVPVLAASLAVGKVLAALMAAALAAVMLAIVLSGDRHPGVTAAVRVVWSALAVASALAAVTVAFDGPVAGPVLLVLAVVVALGGRHSEVMRWCAVGFGLVGGFFYLANAQLRTLVVPTTMTTPIVVSTLIASVLLVAWAVVIAFSWPADWSWAVAAVIGLSALTTFTVTAGVSIGGEVQGFFAGHVVATICWIGLAASVFRYAAKAPRAKRSLPMSGGVALVAAAVAKLFLFDLGTLDGIFRVVVFIVTGLALLDMGARYARLLTNSDSDVAR